MITGFNTDVEHDDRVFHVQTEDKGLANPQVETLVYCGGEIVAQRKTGYGQLVEAAQYSEEHVLAQMELQHQATIRDVHNGKFDTAGPKPFGYNLISNRSLDEVVRDYLAHSVELERIRLELLDRQELVEGTRPTLRMKVIEERSQRPVCGAEVRVSLVSSGESAQELFFAPTDEDGFVEASFAIPETADPTALVCRAEVAGKDAVVEQSVIKGKGPDSAP
ncbi:MAG TPA: hypothetical protein VJS92_06605 [Candidatus Polarisedimenticolaceae bacterium]|nr:hypothetical protein [Candidatus Polarisedimenticolaceae bacterium]